MPTYEYVCQSCEDEFDIFQNMSDDRLVVCPTCSESSLKRKIGIGAGIIFKGSGFYETDYRSSNYKDSAKKDSAKLKTDSESKGKKSATNNNKSKDKKN